MKVMMQALSRHMNEIVKDPAQPPNKQAINALRKTQVRKRQGGWFKWLVILLGVAAAVCAGIRYWANPASAEMEYRTSPVTRGDVTQIVTANGSLNPVQLVEVGSQ